VVLSEELCILSSCFLSPMSKNSVLDQFIELVDWQSSTKRFAEGHFVGGLCLGNGATWRSYYYRITNRK